MKLTAWLNLHKFAPNATAPRRTVYATREVIVAAGALHSAQLLQLSGFGPAALLEQFDIPIALDLPGVGNNLQDHCLVGTFYPCKRRLSPIFITPSSDQLGRQQCQLSVADRARNECHIQYQGRTRV